MFERAKSKVVSSRCCSSSPSKQSLNSCLLLVINAECIRRSTSRGSASLAKHVIIMHSKQDANKCFIISKIVQNYIFFHCSFSNQSDSCAHCSVEQMSDTQSCHSSQSRL